MRLTYVRTILSIGILFFITNLAKAQSGPTFILNQLSYQSNSSEKFIEENIDFPEEQEEILSEFELMIMQEIGKAMSFEDRKSTIFSLIKEAKTYIGTPYVYGGSTRKGIDCSAFMQSVYSTNEIPLPRISRNQALLGDKIPLQDIEMGDMIFFSNSPNSSISHVGMVVEVTEDDIHFIHAGTSTGVIISPLSTEYWNKRFRYAKRVFGKTTEDFLANK